jgi:hypothetical protein
MMVWLILLPLIWAGLGGADAGPRHARRVSRQSAELGEAYRRARISAGNNIAVIRGPRG